ncbi:MAG: tetratricopeptide repeat protein, partial [Phycisphaerae bacterium]
GKFDYAIDMYIEGLRLEPDDVKNGHIPLRQLALLRQSRGGKKPSIAQRIKSVGGKTPLEQMLKAEVLLARDPDNLTYAYSMLKAAVAAGYTKTAQWLADLLFEANAGADKPSVSSYIMIKDAYSSIGKYDKAAAACYQAMKLKPDDDELADEYKRLGAEITVSKGKYDTGENFRKAVKDIDRQDMLAAKDGIVKSDAYRNTLIEAARAEVIQHPDSVSSILNLANTLADLESEDAENEAMKILEDAYVAKMDFSLKKRAGEIAITQLRRKIRKARADSADEQAIGELKKQLNEELLEHWKLCVQNYPTDLGAKYEYGLVLLENGLYDDAIPLLQQAQNDPRRKIQAMSKIGLCFYHKGWLNDAIDVFSQAIDAHEIKDDAIGKELRYNMGLCYQKLGQTEKALDVFRKIAQVDFAYRDVGNLVEELRKQGE